MDLDAVEILLVEDSDEDAELALRALKKQRLANQVHRVADGAAALEYLFGPTKGAVSSRLRMVLLDLKLPKVDGMEVLRALKGHPVARTIPVIVLTSSKEDRDLEEAYRLGVNSYIVKPVDFEQFVKSVGDVGLYWAVLNQPPGAKREP